MSISCLSGPLVPGNVPLPVHQEMDILNALIVGVVQSLWQVLLQVRFEVLVCFLTLQENNMSRELTDYFMFLPSHHFCLLQYCTCFSVSAYMFLYYLKTALTVRSATTALGSSEKQQ